MRVLVCLCGTEGPSAWQWGVAVGPSTWQSGCGSVAVGAWQCPLPRGRCHCHTLLPRPLPRGRCHCHATATPYCHALLPHRPCHAATPRLPRCHTPTATLPHPDCHAATPRLPHCHTPNATWKAPLPHPTATLKAPQFHIGTPKLAQHVALNMYVCASALPFLAKKCKQEGLVNRSVIT